jgi:hypothetical protein
MRSPAQIRDEGRRREGNPDDEEVCPKTGAMEYVAWEKIENWKRKFGVLRTICQKFVKICQNSDRDKSHRGLVEIAKTLIDHEWRDKARIPGSKIRHKKQPRVETTVQFRVQRLRKHGLCPAMIVEL